MPSLEQARDGFSVLQGIVGVGEVWYFLLYCAAAALVSEHAADAQRGGGAVAGDGAAPSQALQLIVTQTFTSKVLSKKSYDEGSK